jgi:hypothetical protein
MSTALGINGSTEFAVGDCCIYAEGVVGVRRSGGRAHMNAPRSSRNAIATVIDGV